MVKADLHNHLRTSSRIRDTDFNKAVDKARKRLGQGGVIGMVNFADARYEDLVSRPGYERHDIGNAVYVPGRDILIIKGQEVPTQEGHLLVLGLQKDTHLKGGRPVGDTIKEARDNNGVIIADHPMHIDGLGEYLYNNQHVLKDIDALEVINAEANFWLPFFPIPKAANKKAITLMNALRNHPHIGSIASSDGHSFYEIGRTYTYITPPDIKDSDTLAKTLRDSVRWAEYLKSDSSRLVGYLGALDHAADLLAIIGLSKIGIETPFEARESYRIKE